MRRLRDAGVGSGALVALAVAPGVGAAIVARGSLAITLDADRWANAVAEVERELSPRWVWWSQETARSLVDHGIRPARAWDLAAVHRLLHGGWRDDPARVWARAHGLATDDLPTVEAVDLFHQASEDDAPAVRDDGHLDPSWVDDGWRAGPARLTTWATLALDVAGLQEASLREVGPVALATARSESTVEALCAELAADGLPVDREAAADVIASFIGPRPRDAAEEQALRSARDAAVLDRAPGTAVDLRSPGQVKSLLRRVGIEVPDTRAWRLEASRDAHPVVDALLAWRKAERVATTYGWGWLDQAVGPDGRLRGDWTGSDGAAGRMTASAGLHNLPHELRRAVRSPDGCVLVRSDLGQIEPRVLAAVSGDAALAAATADDDMYRPVAGQLGVDRATAKVAVLGAMYGQTTGHGAQAMARLRTAYPVAVAYLEQAAATAEGGRDVFTYGGRRVRMGAANANDASDRQLRSQAAARGRYGRNAVVQGAAAEMFKTWALLVRARTRPLGAHIVLCLHDELLVEAPEERGAEVAALVDACLAEAAARWAPATPPVRFTADTTVVRCWADAK